MNASTRPARGPGFARRLAMVLNLNDTRWGRDGDSPEGRQAQAPAEPREDSAPPPPPAPPPPARPRGTQAGPPDLDELWRDFNRKLGALLGGGRGRGPGRPPAGNGGGGGHGGFQPGMRPSGVGVGVIVGTLLLLWLATGFFIVQEGQQAVITRFGRYKATVGAGINWRLPVPIERHELVYTSQIRSVDVGRDSVVKSTGLRESAMLTRDENILEVKFAVQYRLKDARAWLFESADPGAAVVQAAESAVREVVGKMDMDDALAEERDQIAPRVRALMQEILDRYKVGVEIAGINLQQGGVGPPEQVRAAFDDVLKAGQERERAKNDAAAYANDVVPRAVGAAARMKEEAEGYKSRIVAQAQGDTQRFASVLPEYQRAPQVTRDRMYLETMQGIYAGVNKVLVDARQGGNILSLPLEAVLKAQAQQAASTTSEAVGADATSVATPAAPAATPAAAPGDARVRDSARTRDREAR